jgi:pimeloyl-ACP methyl ester carboxylesterase
MTPEGYAAWIEHLVKRGNIVIYPRYQAALFSAPDGYTGHSITALKDAFAELQKENHVKPDQTRVAIVGHSYGGVIAANLAVLASKNNLPAFKAVMCVEPGTGGFGKVYENYSLIPAKTLLICVAGIDDANVRDFDAKRIYKEASSVAREDKDYIVMRTDRHGKPPVVADHFAPAPALNASNALRWYGMWKWFDGLTDAAFNAKNRNYALGGTPEQRFMGKWSDGQPITEPKVTKEP